MSIDYNETITVIKDFIKRYLKNAGSKSLVIGLSGGIDSAVTAILCKQTIGKENTKCVFLPDDTTPEIDKKHQKILVKKYDLNCKTKNITKLVKNVEENSLIKPDTMALANIKARIRMVLLYEYANVTQSLVCGTSNKSEILIGYYTKYGDGGVDIMPIGDLYKTQIYELAKKLKLPKEIIKKPPRAGLMKNQKDEDELKLDYYQIDKILRGLEEKEEISKIAESNNVNIKEIKKIRNMRIKTQHKRRTPLIPKIGLRTPGLDWRSPVQEG
ncbi:MAG: NAD+ synthase [Candidatus Thermoplasmatota archaeon]